MLTRSVHIACLLVLAAALIASGCKKSTTCADAISHLSKIGCLDSSVVEAVQSRETAAENAAVCGCSGEHESFRSCLNGATPETCGSECLDEGNDLAGCWRTCAPSCSIAMSHLYASECAMFQGDVQMTEQEAMADCEDDANRSIQCGCVDLHNTGLICIQGIATGQCTACNGPMGDWWDCMNTGC